MKKLFTHGTPRVLFLLLIWAPSVWAQNPLIPREPLAYTSPVSLQNLVEGNNDFGFDLFHQILQSLKDNQNMVFSPYSISTCLGMAWVGARNNTQIQMGQVLHLSADRQTVGSLFQELSNDLATSNKNDNFHLDIANSLWIKNDDYFLQPFLDELNQDFYATPMLVNFLNSEPIRLQINQWVADHTDQKIESLFGPHALPPTTKMVLVNAVYFKANWQYPFKSQNTQLLPFHTSMGDTPVSMIQQQKEFLFAQNNEAQILEMPYQNDQFSMVIILPLSFELSTYFLQEMTPSLLTQWVSQMKYQTVEVKLPKFNFSYGSVELKPFLQDLGMTDAFSRELADFSGMTSFKRERLNIDQVVHKAFVSVNETGTEAAAATGVVIVHAAIAMRNHPSAILFNADHPFLFFIRDNQTQSILFMGRVADPSPTLKTQPSSSH